MSREGRTAASPLPTGGEGVEGAHTDSNLGGGVVRFRVRVRVRVRFRFRVRVTVISENTLQ